MYIKWKNFLKKAKSRGLLIITKKNKNYKKKINKIKRKKSSFFIILMNKPIKKGKNQIGKAQNNCKYLKNMLFLKKSVDKGLQTWYNSKSQP